MNFFTRTTDPDKWKEKYLNLLDEQERSERTYQENEDVLSKIIVRLTIATTGLDPHLDPHLLSIREQLKNGISNETLKDELEKFTNAVTQLKHAPAKDQASETGLLFEFLLRQYPGKKQQTLLKTLQKRAETAGFSNTEQLFATILEAIEPGGPRPETEESLVNHIDIAIVSKQLLHLLNGIEVPSVFDRQVQTAKQLLSAGNQTAASFESILDKSFKLLLKIKQHSQSEQQDIDKFLSHITEQLAALDVTIMGASTAAQKSAESRDKLDQSVSAQMEQLKLSSTNATKLEPLKEIITIRLAGIAKEIEEHNQKEAIERQKTQQQLDELLNKIKDMETESSELKSKLKIANTQALRDALTGLPNRQAYNERLAMEMARWKRYGSPLSLIVWDIDHFKSINDNYGHKAGDKVLLLIAKQLSDNCRATDFISRFGGEEFVMLLPNTDAASALIHANHLRRAIEKTGFNASGTSVDITISCGVTEFLPSDNDESAFERADQALYQAKEEGRNRCCML